MHLAYLMGFEISSLCSIAPKEEDSMLFHYPATRFLKVFEEAYGIPLLLLEGSGDEMEDLRNLLSECKSEGIEYVVSGALASDYQRIRYSIVAEELGLKTLNPLWRKDQKEYMKWLIEGGFEYIIVKISSFGLPFDLLGKTITYEDTLRIISLAEKYGFNPAFEGGEAETLVLDAPLMKKRLEVEGERRIEGNYVAYYDIRNIKLVEKRKIR
ncbi:diphthine--ammonia ligase [Fervidicoccus fontis]|jgi:predicted ATP pyrophosphatase (TIGR00289 family)|uniref:Diphthine--ammonia ligase n=1 Tax=Fervidicoccus fontis TaxID=683846 RepID=A0A843AGL6_9CREN|nr:diphthine--ammonia ligase [Fervidicoccus fontis]PNV81270.1 MAG: ATP-binding protein [Fervidicoccus sp.]